MEFRRINALPPYAFAQIDALKMQLRRAGEDVIDLAFGNPDIPSPDDRGREARRGGAQPAQPSLLDEQGHPEAAPRGRRPLRAHVRRHARLRDRDLLDDRCEGRLLAPDAHARRAGRHRARAVARRTRSTSGARSSPAPACTTCAWDPDQDFFENLRAAYEQAWPRPRVIVTSFPHNPTTACVDLDVHGRSSSSSRVNARSSSCTTSRTPTSASTATNRRRSCRCPARRMSRSSCTRSRSRSRWRAGAWASSSATPRSSPRSRKLKSYLDYGIVPAHPDRGDRRDERGARLPEGSQRDLPRPPRRADRRARPHRLAHRTAQGDDVRLGAASPSRTPR